MAEYCSLNTRYGIPDQVRFKEGPSGMAVVEIASPSAEATIALQGAQLIGWDLRGEESVIWLSPAARFAPGKSIRGGVPVCWPWFGSHATEPSFPAHGFARTSSWGVTAAQQLPDGSTRLTFRLIQSEQTRALWPYPSDLELHITVGAVLEMDLITRNTGVQPIVIGNALHTYIEVSDVRDIAILGLDGCSYIDKVRGGERKRQAGPVIIAAEVDRIYLASTGDCVIEDPGLKRRILISKRGSSSTVVWNPWIDKAERLGDLGEDGYLRMVCVESANAADDVVTVAPGDEHHLWVRYQVEALG